MTVNARRNVVALCRLFLTVLSGTSQVLHEDGVSKVRQASDASVLSSVIRRPFVVTVVFRMGVHLHFYATFRLADEPRHVDAQLVILYPCSIGQDGDEGFCWEFQDCSCVRSPQRVFCRFSAGDADNQRTCIFTEVQNLLEGLFCHVLAMRGAVLHTMRTGHVAAIFHLSVC